MNDKPRRPKDQNPADRDMPIKRPTAADHRPDQGDDGTGKHAHHGEVHNQNLDAKLPNPAQLQKQQRSPNMNTEKNK
ncbi:MAG: hypothetical protein CVT64_00755 [Actinobacteria bacterium HGW-Actinobacteria-4]|nr:MAG: hypothetical protein CVT64_00755 [Actinobacteria bacterium HGW-Actinobacteria-4]